MDKYLRDLGSRPKKMGGRRTRGEFLGFGKLKSAAQRASQPRKISTLIERAKEKADEEIRRAKLRKRLAEERERRAKALKEGRGESWLSRVTAARERGRLSGIEGLRKRSASMSAKAGYEEQRARREIAKAAGRRAGRVKGKSFFSSFMLPKR